MGIEIRLRELSAEDQGWVRDFLLTYNHATQVVTRGKLHQADKLPGFMAVYAGEPSGLLTYRVADEELEVVTLHTAIQGKGLGSRLLKAAQEKAVALGCRRLWLITTNDNTPAIHFYERRGMKLRAVHHGAIQESRRLKPEIPMLGIGGTPIEDEMEFEYRL